MCNKYERFRTLIGRKVVLDTDSQQLYIGHLASVDNEFLDLVEADVHDVQSTNTTRDMYIINTAKFGIKKNRERVLVMTVRVVSVSLLEEITLY